MPIRMPTPEETRAWLGSAVVMPGLKRPSSSEKNSTQPSNASLPTYRPDSAQDQADEDLEAYWRRAEMGLEQIPEQPKTESSDSLVPSMWFRLSELAPLLVSASGNLETLQTSTQPMGSRLRGGRIEHSQKCGRRPWHPTGTCTRAFCSRPHVV